MLDDYDKKKILSSFSPLLFLFLIIFTLVLYGWSVGDSFRFIVIFIVALITLLPFLIVPGVNLVLLLSIGKFHDFTADLVGLTGDQYTLALIMIMSIIYVCINYFIVVVTLAALIVAYTRYETEIFKRVTPLMRTEEQREKRREKRRKR